MSYRVTVPLVLARDKEGKVHERYQDAVIDWLDDDQKQHFLEAELVEQVGGSDDADSDDGPPAKTAPKPEWVAWAVAQSAATDEPLTAEEADQLYTKPELIENFG